MMILQRKEQGQMIDFRSLPRLDASISYLYIEHAIVDKKDNAIEIIRKSGRTLVPIAATTCLFLGPGTSITHAAIGVITEVGCSCIWCGEKIRKFYASGIGETRQSKNLLLQAKLCMDEELHLEVAKRMYKLRFPDFKSISKMSLEQMRGLEGTRMRSIYKIESKKTGVPWHGRKYDPKRIDASDEINKALTIANALLYGICQSAIVTLGLSPGLGFIHTGHALSFVYDIADLYKSMTTIPASFEAVNKKKNTARSIDEIVREVCRKYFFGNKILSHIPTDISYLFGCDLPNEKDYPDYNDIWVNGFEVIDGGKNYSGDEEDLVW